ncbi:cytochrome P450 [Ascobolus immersus RN42]|uniref:Cytochrome P450 n=1 Tax=Ascobolus immersus RN42 TaxID=1160509 RepID=A0A3N4HWJ8_ASCIM|nr:cytochrome P450 [Ascobolus immersus RN42]
MIDLSALFDSPTHAALVFITITAIYHITSSIFTTLRHRRASHTPPCSPPFLLPESGWFGIGGYRWIKATFRSGRHLPVFFERCQKYGVDTIQLQVLHNTSTHTMAPENVKAILATQFEDFSLAVARKRFFDPVFGDGIFNSEGETWKHSRGLLRPQFARGNIADLEEIGECVESFIKRIYEDGKPDASNGVEIDLQPLLYMLTLDSATGFLFGASVDSLKRRDLFEKKEDDYTFAEAFDKSLLYTRDQVRAGPLRLDWFIRQKADFKKCVQGVHSFVDSHIRNSLNRVSQREKDGLHTENPKFLESLASETSDPIVIRDQLTNLLLAGRDTTAAMLEFSLFELARHPDIYAKLRSEVLKHFGRDPKKLTYEALKDCHYLQWIMNETLRLHPPVPINGRIAIRDTTLPTGGGPTGTQPFFVPKGGRVTYSVWSMHRRPDLFGPDAASYIPERWDPKEVSEGRRKKVPSWAYVPFNGGPRICLGQQYALTEGGYVLARLAMEFEKVAAWTGEEEEEVEMAVSLTAKSARGCRVRLWRDPVGVEGH